MYVLRNSEASLCKHCSHGKAISITYSECVFVVLISQHAKRMRHTILSLQPVRLYGIFPHYLINGTIFGGKNKVFKVKMCVLVSYTNFFL
jgi:hypothetical protein